MISQTATEYFNVLSELQRSVEATDHQGVLSLDEGAKRAVELILAVRAASGKVMLIGNGGSAAIASHMQMDLCNAADVRALVFNEPPLLTALSNDHGYGSVFERPVELWATPGDLLLAISSSGRSENILRGVRKSAERRCEVITLSGFGADNPLRRMGAINFYVPSRIYGHVEVIHSALAHFLTDCAMTARGDSRKPGE